MPKTDAGYVLDSEGLRFTRELSENELADIGRTLAGLDCDVTWAMGDWLVKVGRTDLKPRNGASGSSFEWASEVTGLPVELLRIRWAVAEAFPPHVRRRKTLNWTIHRVTMQVVPDKRQEVLRIFENFGKPRTTATVAEARSYIKTLDKEARRAERKKRSQTEPKKRYGVDLLGAHVRCPHCRKVFPIKGNKVSRKELQDGVGAAKE